MSFISPLLCCTQDSVHGLLKCLKKKSFTEFVIGLLFQGGAQMSRTPSGSAVLMAGQAYTVMVALRMPESPKNTDLVSALELQTSITICL